MKTSISRIKFERLLANVARLLHPEGFERRREAFYKPIVEGDVQLIVDFQRSASHDNDRVKFTINLGVFSSHLCQHSWGKVPKPPAIWDAQIQERIGFLLPRRKDVWWTLNEKTTMSLLDVEIAGILTLSGLPFLRQFDSEREMRRFLLRNTSSYEDALNALLLTRLLGMSSNEVKKATDLVKRVGKTAGVQKETIDGDVAKALRISKEVNRC